MIQEAIKGHISNGGTVYQAFYDLEKAFDSVEFHILLSHVYNAGIKSKTWRLIYYYNQNQSSQVRIGNHCSSSFPLNRGVRQGAVLPPMLFIIVNDSLLKELASIDAGINLGNTYIHWFLWAC